MVFMQSKNIIRLALVVTLILLVPFLAMQFTGEVRWGPADFAFAGALLFGTGLAFEFAARKVGAQAYRAAVGLALGTALLFSWISIAVGIIGSEDNPANLMYIGVLAVLIIGALIANFRHQGMASALLATALAQALVTVIALIAEKFVDALELVLLNGFFVALWLGSALLFRRASAALSRHLEQRRSSPSP